MEEKCGDSPKTLKNVLSDIKKALSLQPGIQEASVREGELMDVKFGLFAAHIFTQ